MSGVGIQALLPLFGIHAALTHYEIMALVEMARALGNAYRLAASEPGSSVLYGRFTLNFCRAIVACVAH
jgi:hypothetical protein